MSRQVVVTKSPGVIMSFILGIGFLIKFTFRFVLGRPLGSKRKTDATWSRRGTVQLDKQTRVWDWWDFRTERQRALFRLIGVLVLAAQAWLWLHLRTVAVVLDVAAVVALVWLAVRVGLHRWRTRTVRREVIAPLQAALTHRLSIAPNVPASEWLSVPLGYRTDPERRVVIALPQGFDRDAHGAAIEALALDRLRIEEPVVSWHNYGANPTVTIGARLAPPDKVFLHHVMPAILAAKETDLVLGMGSGGKIVTVSYWLDSPHLALSAPSQSGKSTAIAGILAQQMRWGSFALILDFRAESHTWAFHLPNAMVLTDIPRIHAAMIAMLKEIRRRQQLVKNAAMANRPKPEFPRVWVAMEELNLTMPELRNFWNEYRAEDPERAKRIPKTSPAIAALAALSYAGRSVGFHGIFVAQRLTAIATGDPSGAVRESLGIRYMIKPKVSTWKMLADGASTPRFASKSKGRAHVVVDGVSTELQGTLITDEELKELATSGMVTEPPEEFAELESGPLTEDVLVLSGRSTDVGAPEVDRVRTADSGQPADSAPAELEAPEPVYLTVEEAVNQGILSGKVESLQRTLRRDTKNNRPSTPQIAIVDGVRKYSADELATWRDSRVRDTEDTEQEDEKAREVS